MRTPLAAVAASLVLPISAAAAQEPTPENAQRFLITTLEGSQQGVVDSANGSVIGWGTMNNFASSRTCQTEYTATYPRVPNYEPITPARLAILWDKVTEVRQEANGVQIRAQGLPYPIRIRLSSETIAARVTYAMEFLRQHCDPVAGTGF